MDLLILLLFLLRPFDDLMDIASRIPTWSREEALEFLRRFQRAALQAILIPFIILVAAALLGGEVPLLKRVLVYIGSFLAAWFAVIIAWRSLPMAAILAALLEVASHSFQFYRKLADRFEKAAEFYVKLVGLVLANELWIGMFVFVTPIHNRPEALVPVLLLTGIILSWTMWKGGVEWWPRIIYVSSLILLLLFIVSFWFPVTAEKVQSFEPEQWLYQTLEQRGKERKRQEQQRTAPRVEPPAYEVLEDGAIALNRGAVFSVKTGSTVPFRFHREGLFIVEGTAKISAPLPVTLPWSGEVTHEFEIDAAAHNTRYGGPPCFYGDNPFRYTISALRGDILLRARMPGEKCS